MPLRRHTDAWYDRLARRQAGYYYPWTSTLDQGNGEALYEEWVRNHLTPRDDVLEVGCGHGVDALAFAARCRSLRAYDRVDRWLSLARAAARERGIANVTFVLGNARADLHGGRVRLPALTASVDLVVSRRGPSHWIEDARRVCRPGATLIQLNPLARARAYEWEAELPPELSLPPLPTAGDDGTRQAVASRLAGIGLGFAETRICDVAEWLATPLDLYRFLTFGADADEVPPRPAVAGVLTRLFEGHATGAGLPLRQRRFLWRVRMD